MITCKECVSWHRHAENVGNQYHGQCQSVKFFDHAHSTPAKSNELMYWSRGDSYADFSTGQDFGCIHGKKK